MVLPGEPRKKSPVTPPGIDPGTVRHIPSDRTMALGSTQPLSKMSTRNIPGGKSGRCVRLTTSPPSCAESHEIWETKPSGTLWATLGLLRDSFNLQKIKAVNCWRIFTVNCAPCHDPVCFICLYICPFVST